MPLFPKTGALIYFMKERGTASKKTKTETITKPQTVIDLGKDLPTFCAVSNVDLENFNLTTTTNIKDLLEPFIQQIREIRIY